MTEDSKTEKKRASAVRKRAQNIDPQQALLGAAAIAAAAGAAYVIGNKLRAPKNKKMMSDAPASTRRDGDAPIGRTVTINKPREELYAFWRDFKNQTQFADNIDRVDILDDKRTRFVMKAPAGTMVNLVNRVVDDIPGKRIAWESEPESDVRNSGSVEFSDAAPGRGTTVRVTISYDPPGGKIGKMIAKVLQREPNVQARRDLRRFKQLMETGEVTSSASPSGRKNESPTEQAL